MPRSGSAAAAQRQRSGSATLHAAHTADVQCSRVLLLLLLLLLLVELLLVPVLLPMLLLLWLLLLLRPLLLRLHHLNEFYCLLR